MGRVMPKILVLLSILFIPTIAGMAPAEPASASNFSYQASTTSSNWINRLSGSLAFS
jgi:hypothetical protein